MSTIQQGLSPGEQVDELLSDPIVELVMRRDGVTRDDVLEVMADMRRRLYGAPVPSACFGQRSGSSARAGLLMAA